MKGNHRIFIHGRQLVLGMMMLLLSAAPGRAQEPLCGIHALYSAALLEGLDAKMSDLLHPQYVGSEQGSSIAELERAAALVGLNSVSLTRLNVNDLRHSPWRAVLHTRADLSSTDYSHFVLFVGFETGRAVIFDGVKGIRHWTPAEVASRWDGNALLLSADPIQIDQLVWRSRLRGVLWLAAVGFVVLCAGLIEKRFIPSTLPGWRKCRIQVVMLCAVAAYGALVFHAFASNGFIFGAEAVRAVRAANASTFLPRIEFSTAKQLHDQGDAIFVDARTPENFARERITTAVNLPATVSESEAMRIAQLLPLNRRLVVYCANATCPYSYTAAQRLLDAGHRDVVVYAGGLEEWKQKAAPIAADS